MVSITNTVVDEYAVVVEFGYATFAYTAMFRTGRFQKVAGTAQLTWMINCEIIRIQSHLLWVVCCRDIARVGGGSCVKENVRQYQETNGSDFSRGTQHGPCRGEEQYF